MKKSIFLALFLFATSCFYQVFAVPAYPKRVPIVVDGDTLYIQMRGDENCKFAIDEQGYTILPTDSGWFYAQEDATGNAVVSEFQLLPLHTMSESTKVFLKQTRKGIMPAFNVSVKKSTASIGRDNQAKMPATGFRKVLVILMQFRDKKFTKDATEFQKLFNEEGYKEDGAVGSVHDYYQWASYGQLNLQSDVMGPYTAKHDMSYYGGNNGVGGGDKNPYALFEESINEVVKEIDLSEYDANGDGYVDNVHIIYAGFGEEAGASSNAIWAHEMTFRPITIQGMKIDRYSCAPELRGNRGTGISRIGPHCHEIGHALGAMDYYDTDYETAGSYLGTGDWDIMASGSWNNEGISPAGFNPYVKIYDYGWTNAKTLIADTTNIIKPSTGEGSIFRIDTGTKNDYYLLENRSGTDFHGAEPGKGLLIFHIGPQLETKAATNTINSSYPQQCYVVCASSTYKRPSSSANTYGKINSAGCPFPGTSQKHEFSDISTPAALTVSGRTTGIRLTDIDWDENDIRLFYGNGLAADTTSTLGTYSWREDFEQMRIPSSWNYTDVEGLGEFTVTTTLSGGDTPQVPTAASGRGYAKYAALSQNGLGRHHIRGLLTTPKIALTAGKQYMCTLKTRKYARLEDACDSLAVYLYDMDGNIIDYSIKKEINNQESWEQLSSALPDSIIEFSLGIECYIDYGSIMFIDDISITENNNESGIFTLTQYSPPIIRSIPNGLYIKVQKACIMKVFSLNGICICNKFMNKDSSETLKLNPGIYVICIGNERYKYHIE